MAPPGALDERLLQLDREWAALLQTIDEEKRTAFEEARRKLVELLHASSPAVEQPVASAAPAAATSAGPVSFSVCGDILRRILDCLAKRGEGRTLGLASGVCKEWRREATAEGLWETACLAADQRESCQAVTCVEYDPMRPGEFRYAMPHMGVISRQRLEARGLSRTAFRMPDATEAVAVAKSGNTVYSSKCENAVLQFALAFGQAHIDAVVISPEGYFRDVLAWDPSTIATPRGESEAVAMFKKVSKWASRLNTRSKGMGGGAGDLSHTVEMPSQGMAASLSSQRATLMPPAAINAPGPRTLLAVVRKVGPAAVKGIMQQKHLGLRWQEGTVLDEALRVVGVADAGEGGAPIARGRSGIPPPLCWDPPRSRLAPRHPPGPARTPEASPLRHPGGMLWRGGRGPPPRLEKRP